jgi:hypothetical protein
MAPGTPRLMDDLVDLFENDLVIEILYSAPGEGRQTPKYTFNKATLPPEHIRCPDTSCSGEGFLMFDTMWPYVENRGRALANGTRTDRLMDERIQTHCAGHEMRDGKQYAHCFKGFEVHLTGTLK